MGITQSSDMMCIDVRISLQLGVDLDIICPKGIKPSIVSRHVDEIDGDTIYISVRDNKRHLYRYDMILYKLLRLYSQYLTPEKSDVTFQNILERAMKLKYIDFDKIKIVSLCVTV